MTRSALPHPDEGYREARYPQGSFEYLFQALLQTRQGPGIMAQSHFHEYYEILYVHEGEFQLLLSDQSYRFSKGEMALIDPMELHHVLALGEGKHEYIVLKFAPELLESASEPLYELKYHLAYQRPGMRHTKVFLKDELENTPVKWYVESVFREYVERDYGYELAVRSGMCGLFAWILRAWQNKTGLGQTGDMRAEDWSLLSRALNYIEENAAGEITLSDAADFCGMTYTAFSRFFSQYTEKGFSEYLTYVRLRRSLILLTTTRQSVTEIAMACGFSTSSYFISRFRQAYGETPGHFRRRFANL